jgi:hypothetical protein
MYSNGLVFRCPVPENQSSEHGASFQMVEAFLVAILLKPLNIHPDFKW